MVKLALLAILLPTSSAAAELPLMGLSHVGIRVSDTNAARAFYSGVLGFPNVASPENTAIYKVNDRQYLEILPGLRRDDIIPMTHIAIWTENLRETRRLMIDRGLSPTEIREEPGDHNLTLSLRELPGQSLAFLEFVQYPVHSILMTIDGTSRRLSTRLEHAGIVTTDLDAALEFYVTRLGFQETWRRVNGESKRVALVHLRMPGLSGDYIELSNLAGNTSLTRTRAGSAAHCSLEVPDIKTAYQATLDRGETRDRKEPRFGLDLRWQFNLFDADGTRVELMQPRDKGTPLPPVAYGN